MNAKGEDALRFPSYGLNSEIDLLWRGSPESFLSDDLMHLMERLSGQILTITLEARWGNCSPPFPSSPLSLFPSYLSRAWMSQIMTTRSLLLPAGSLTRSSNTALTEKPAFLKALKAPWAWR